MKIDGFQMPTSVCCDGASCGNVFINLSIILKATTTGQNKESLNLNFKFQVAQNESYFYNITFVYHHIVFISMLILPPSHSHLLIFKRQNIFLLCCL